MSKLPFLPLYVPEYDAATNYMSLAEDGLYCRALRLMWATPKCSLPSDQKWLMQRLRINEDEYNNIFWPLCEEYFTINKGRITQKRLRFEWEKANKIAVSRKVNGKLGGQAKALKTNKKTSSETLPSTSTATASKKPSKKDAPQVSRFEDFWKAYPKRKGNPKEPARKSFEKAVGNGVDPDVIINAAKAYAKDEKKRNKPEYTAHAVTWLNQLRWESEDEVATGAKVSLEAVYNLPDDDITSMQWEYLSDLLVKKIGVDAYNSWFSDVDFIEETEERALIWVKKKFTADRMKNDFAAAFKQATGLQLDVEVR